MGGVIIVGWNLRLVHQDSHAFNTLLFNLPKIFPKFFLDNFPLLQFPIHAGSVKEF